MNQKLDLREPILKTIGELADRELLHAYVVGGYVRDLLLGKAVKDIDIVVIGHGVNFGQKVAQAFGRTNLVIYENFGTAMLQLDDWKLEFVGARKESYAKHSRKPEVEVGTL